MNTSKYGGAAKRGAEYFSTGAGAVTIILSIIAVFVAIPLAVSLPVAGAVGLAFAAYGVYSSIKQYNEKQAEIQRRTQEQRLSSETNFELMKFAHDIRNEIKQYHSHDLRFKEIIQEKERCSDSKLANSPRFFTANNPNIIIEEKIPTLKRSLTI